MQGTGGSAEETGVRGDLDAARDGQEKHWSV